MLVDVAEHANTNAVTVELQEQANLLVIRVSDYGSGFNVAAADYEAVLNSFGYMTAWHSLRVRCPSIPHPAMRHK